MKRVLFSVVFLVILAAFLVSAQQQNFGNATLGATQTFTGTNTFAGINATSLGATTPGTIAATTVAASGAITSTLATGSAPLVVASTTPVATMVVSAHPQVQFCGTTSSCSHTAQTAGQIVYGSAALVSGTPSTVTITGISPAFTSNTSYKCFVDNQTNQLDMLTSVTSYASGSSFVITGPNTLSDVIAFVCVGT